MTRRRQRVGKAGEEAARNYLLKKGHRVIETNFRCPYGEIDLITFDGGTLVFVEVRTRTSSSFGTPAESITPGKLGRLKKAASFYMKSRYRQEVACRFDLIAVQMEREKIALSSLRHYRSILG